MQIAYTGNHLTAVTSFRESPPVANPEQARTIKGAVYVAHGEADAFIPREWVTTYQSTLDDAGADLQWVSFPGVRHAFTNPGADTVGMEDLRYDRDAGQQSWQQSHLFSNKMFN